MLTETDLQHEAARMVDREVHCCLSSLVATLAQGAFRVQPVRIVLSGKNAEAETLLALTEQAHELASPVDDYEEAARQVGWYITDDRFYMDDGYGKGDDAAPDSLAGEWRDLCEEFGIEPYSREVFEHWAVSDWLADKLTSRGEKVDRDFANLNVWARTTTGQAVSMDGVIREITQEIFK